jgi:transposase-like protein
MAGSRYSDSFKSKMVQRILMPGGTTALGLSKEIGIPNGTLSRWVRQEIESRSVGHVVTKKHSSPTKPPRRSEDWNKKERLRVVLEASRLTGEELGAYLRREGLHDETLAAWREEALASLSAPDPDPRQVARDQARITQLERELKRKDERIEATEALLDLAKKVRTLWGEEAAGTNEDKDK